MSAWKSLAWLDIADLPQVSGVYVIYRNTKPVYVGQSRNLFARVRQHAGYIAQSGADTEELRVKYKPCSRAGEWLALEYRLILRLRPELNQPILPAKLIPTIAGRKRVPESMSVIRARAARRKRQLTIRRTKAKLAKRKQREKEAWEALVRWNRSR